MEVNAKARFVRISPRKARLVVDAVRGLDVIEAQQQLQFMQKKAAKVVLKLLNSAIANAENNFELKRTNLFIKKLVADDGPTYKRWMPRAFGRATPLRKRTSHISIVLEEKVPSNKPVSTTKKKTAATQTVSADAVKKATKPESVQTDEKKPVTEENAPETVDSRMQGKHRHNQHQDSIHSKQDKGFLKQVFRRKSGE
jgi:large subunit ribosomal protein L22